MDSANIQRWIGVPWVVCKTDCISVCADALREMGLVSAAEALDGEIDSEKFEEVSPPYRDGDILLSAGGDGALHVSVIYDDTNLRVLSSAKVVGGYTCRFDSVRNLMGVYRHEDC